MRPIDTADYLRPGVNPRTMRRRFDLLVNKITASKIKFDAVAFRGFSGCIFGPSLAMHFGVHMNYVRKAHESLNSHSWRDVEGRIADGAAFNYIIVDELCAGGTTIRAIRDALDTRGGKCVGIFLWNQDPAQADHPRFPKGIPIFYFGGKTWTYELRAIGTVTKKEALELAGLIDGMLTNPLPKLLAAPPVPMKSLGRAYRAYVDEAAPVPETIYKWESELTMKRAMEYLSGNVQAGLPSGSGSPDVSKMTATQVMQEQESKVLRPNLRCETV